MQRGKTVRAIDAFLNDIGLYGVALGPDTWRDLSKDFVGCAYAKGDVILSSARVADRWLFLTRGIAASEQTTPEGQALIARFFEPGQICTNITSAWSRRPGSDDLIAITDVEGVLIPDPLFREEYLRGHAFGEYLRLKCMETLLFDKDILCAKTSNDTEVQYRFLEQNYDEVVLRTTQKDLARFIGLTPQGLNRFLQARRVE